MAKTSPAQLAAIKRYNARMAEIKIRLEPRRKEAMQDWAASQGKSLRGYILDLIDHDMQRAQD